MEISLKRNHGYYLIFKADNVNVEEDIETREYTKDENGKVDFKIPPKRDIDTNALNQIVCLLEDMIYYRDAEYDSSDLIQSLFDKLPAESAKELSILLEKEYAHNS